MVAFSSNVVLKHVLMYSSASTSLF
ncbi:hypothetical protein Goarm_003329 [Gossypium armourianum]|uniref:Uncharacterized protein n=3 Tax=Gossypium TaxID=3633 RepID=A0A7J9K3B5_9ROSI|nr:hypothetical protein [Gossypium lobatum]MBA0664148.1 hypothetical protein [Gossypium klotzschianum]MBA0840779.1 hypothetical protein [Gossypium armourianum]